MEPKQKAEDLINKMCNVIESPLTRGLLWNEGKELASIAVDEILNGDHLIRTPLSFWQKVKEEITNA